ncbi:hypothetical protein RYX36_033648 [Vicia faba]
MAGRSRFLKTQINDAEITSQELVNHVPSTPNTISLNRIIEAGVWFTEKYGAKDLNCFFTKSDSQRMDIQKLNNFATSFSIYCQILSVGKKGFLFDYDTGKVFINSEKPIPDADLAVQSFVDTYAEEITYFDSLKLIFSKTWKRYHESKLKKEARRSSRSTEIMSSSGKRMSISGPSEFIKNSKPRTSLTSVMKEADELSFNLMSNRISRLNMTEIIPIIDIVENFYRANDEDQVCCMVLVYKGCATGGQILFPSGQVDDQTIQKYEKEAKDKSRESWLAHLLCFSIEINFYRYKNFTYQNQIFNRNFGYQNQIFKTKFSIENSDTKTNGAKWVSKKKWRYLHLHAKLKISCFDTLCINA